jgi:hypothetical protein
MLDTKNLYLTDSGFVWGLDEGGDLSQKGHFWWVKLQTLWWSKELVVDSSPKD